jgi:membrane-associated phospholipid phosphatase
MRLLMWMVSLPGESYILPVVVLATIVWFFVQKQYKRGLWFGAVNILAFLLSQFIKIATAVPRPLGSYEMGFSFPSGHVLQYVVGLGLLYKWKIARPFCLLMISLVGISRIYLGAHWITDVVMGYVFGWTLLRVISKFEKKWLFPQSA